MKVTFSARCQDMEKDVRGFFFEKASKLEVYLKRFKEDLVTLHGSLEKNPHKDEFYATVSLYLPTGVLYCREDGEDPGSAINLVFLDIVRQIKKHKDKLNIEKRRLRKHPIKGRFR